MKKIMFIISVLLLTLSVGAQKSAVMAGVSIAKTYDFATAVKEITMKAQTVSVEEFSVAAKDFVTKFYPNGFNQEDFVKRASEASASFLPECSFCVGNYINCLSHCSGGCLPCQMAFSFCYQACQGGIPLTKTK